MQISEGRTSQAKETGSVKALNQAWQGQERAREWEVDEIREGIGIYFRALPVLGFEHRGKVTFLYNYFSSRYKTKRKKK